MDWFVAPFFEPCLYSVSLAHREVSHSSKHENQLLVLRPAPVFRSLDRTNVVQSALGKWVLNNQLRQVGVLSVKESIDEHAAFLDLFRNGASRDTRSFLTFIFRPRCM